MIDKTVGVIVDVVAITVVFFSTVSSSLKITHHSTIG